MKIQLSLPEIVAIEDSVILELPSKNCRPPEDFVRKIAYALLNCGDKEIEVDFAEDELHFIIDYVSIRLREGSAPVGFTLKKKVYGLLLNFDRIHRGFAEVKRMVEAVPQEATDARKITDNNTNSPRQPIKRPRGRPRKTNGSGYNLPRPKDDSN